MMFYSTHKNIIFPQTALKSFIGRGNILAHIWVLEWRMLLKLEEKKKDIKKKIVPSTDIT